MFDDIEGLAKAHGLKMTSYVDDVALSGPGASKKIRYEVRHIIALNGLKSHKVRYYRAGGPKVVTGVVINKGRLCLPNRRHLLIKEGYEALLKAETPKEKFDKARDLSSRVHEAAQIDPGAWLPKAREIDKIRREAGNELRASRIKARG